MIPLIAQITDALQGSGLDPDCLELEITESAIMHNTDHTITILQVVAGLGVHLSIDDFGTGYSSLSYLKRFPIDTFKIDRSFIRDIPHDADVAAIASAIIAMAHALDIRVIAEGVETEEQLAFLSVRRCHGVQGLFFSKPVPAKDVPALLLPGMQSSG